MRVTRSYVDTPLAVGQTLALPEDVANHLVRVMRLREGEACVLFNGDGHDYQRHPGDIGQARRAGAGGVHGSAGQ
jgi:16S rRNA U1498 N3-methylase RsmE